VVPAVKQLLLLVLRKFYLHQRLPQRFPLRVHTVDEHVRETLKVGSLQYDLVCKLIPHAGLLKLKLLL
jgi:hypothetical protein